VSQSSSNIKLRNHSKTTVATMPEVVKMEEPVVETKEEAPPADPPLITYWECHEVSKLHLPFSFIMVYISD
jgi:hypothetical protein